MKKNLKKCTRKDKKWQTHQIPHSYLCVSYLSSIFTPWLYLLPLYSLFPHNCFFFPLLLSFLPLSLFSSGFYHYFLLQILREWPWGILCHLKIRIREADKKFNQPNPLYSLLLYLFLLLFLCPSCLLFPWRLLTLSRINLPFLYLFIYFLSICLFSTYLSLL